MKQLLKNVFNQLPFSIKFFIKKNLLKKIDEVEIVYELLKGTKGVMIDVGAHFGTTLAPFMANGWTIHAFEPDPKNREKLLNKIKGNNNVKLSTKAVTNQSGLELSFYSSDISTGISGLSNFHPSHKEVTKVETITLKDYINNTTIGTIDFLKIDTEGHDLFVLQGFDWENHQHPKIIVCEFEDKKSLALGYSFKDLGDFLKKLNYIVLSSEWEPIKQYGVGHKWSNLNEYPCNLNSEYSWGNFIAVKDDSLSKSFKTLFK